MKSEMKKCVNMKEYIHKTTTATASEFSLIPIAARCLVPMSVLILSFLLRGNIQPPAYIIPSFIIIAPSCKGALLKNILRMRKAPA